MTGIERIARERQRQVEVKGWSDEHDDGYDNGEMAMAAACYAAPDLIYVEERDAGRIGFLDPWPWDETDDTRRTDDDNNILPNHQEQLPARVRQLEKAGALIAAEIDRLLRLQRSERPD